MWACWRVPTKAGPAADGSEGPRAGPVLSGRTSRVRRSRPGGSSCVRSGQTRGLRAGSSLRWDVAEHQHAVVVEAGLAAVAGVVTPSRAVEDVLVFVIARGEGQLGLEPARLVGAIHLQCGRFPVVEGAGQVDRRGPGRGTVAERDIVAAVIAPAGLRIAEGEVLG